MKIQLNKFGCFGRSFEEVQKGSLRLPSEAMKEVAVERLEEIQKEPAGSF
ncbi:hypothetical protein HY448_00240 [Candidatus Pacearchaeota archaeon]|nr:hypothetical protein [Candidatus Pacearchaeota archaeon]